jgi:hypothetical protein
VASKTQIRIDVSELKGLLQQIQSASTRTIQMLDRAVVESALLIDQKAKEKIQKGNRSGRVYKRRSVTHRASAPGEPPKTDTGRLVSSIRPTFEFLQAEVGSLDNVARYGGYLEESDKMNRPWLKPTLEENQSEINAKIERAIKSGGLV